jgi:predicted dehydrogenase
MPYLQDVLVTSTTTLLAKLATQRVIILDGSAVPLSLEEEQALCTFVKDGGGLVCIGDAAEVYHEYRLLGELLGPIHGFCTPRCEIIAQVANSNHYITRRVDPTFTVRDAVYLLKHIPSDAEEVWRTTWQYAPCTMAYTRLYGHGRIFCTTLGASSSTRAHPSFQQMLARALSYASGAETQERPLRVAMIGYGAIGFEHGTAINSVPGLEFSLVCDRNQERLALARQSFSGVSSCTELVDIANDASIDLVIVSTPPNTHADISTQMLQAGKHVVSEKPFCLTTAEADTMIQLAEQQRRTLTVYQCRRWDPDYLAIQQIVQRGAIGPIFHMETFIGGYAHPCNYWHSHEPISGGVFYDWGSHYLDWMLQLIPDPVESVRGTEHKRVWHDVTNADQASVYLRFAGGQEATFIHSDIAAALKPKWYILGEQGAIIGNWRHETVKSRRWSGDLIEERLAPSEALPDLCLYTYDGDGIIQKHPLTLPVATSNAFHRNLANHLHLGEPLAVPPEQSRRNIAVMEAAKLSAQQGGETIALKC